jgi:hypothetical protein
MLALTNEFSSYSLLIVEGRAATEGVNTPGANLVKKEQLLRVSTFTELTNQFQIDGKGMQERNVSTFTLFMCPLCLGNIRYIE